MKLIIDIPEEYKALFDTERCKSKFDSLATNEFGYVLRKAFENGTPLDDVKAENMRMIKEKILHHFQDINFYYNDCMMYADLSGMLDELIAESEDKE